MTYKQIEASRELRLWIGQVIVPAVTMAVALASIPEVRNAASTKLEQLKWKLKSRVSISSLQYTSIKARVIRAAGSPLP